MTNDTEIDGTFEAPEVVLERRAVPRRPLMLAAWMWRTRTPGLPIAVRLLDYSVNSVGFISPVALDKNEVFDIALERTGPRHTGLRAARCESLCEDAFRVGGYTLSSDNPRRPGAREDIIAPVSGVPPLSPQLLV